MELQDYLNRIAYSGPTAPTVDVLRHLHRQHLFTVAFENLDIPLKREITLEIERIYDKVVHQHRGGFCYEQNGLFAWALRQIGFDLDILSARVSRPDGSYGPEFDHMLLLVRISGEPWLADVGFGDSFVDPLRFAPNEIQVDRGFDYQIAPQADGYLLRRRESQATSAATPGEWKNQFLFTTAPREFADFRAMCSWQQTSPDSVFTRKRVCSRATPTGRITVTADSLIITEKGRKTETPVRSVSEFEALLHEHFGVDLTGFPATPASAPRVHESSRAGC